MIESRLTADTRKVGHRINGRIYGHFIEHLGRCIYGGVWDADGARQDVMELVREMRPPVVRWPGGLFADVYHWEDGIGSLEKRPVHRNRYWGWSGKRFGPTETNRFGTDEYLDWCKAMEAEPYINVNLGTGTPEEAARWVRHCRDRAPEVNIWGIGNEIYGIWARGHTGPEKYGRRYLEFLRAMKAEAPEIQSVAVGTDETFPNWNRRLLDEIGEELTYLSFHVYLPRLLFFMNFVRPIKDTRKSYQAIVSAPRVMDQKIRWVANQIARALGRDHNVKIALDEWNLWWGIGHLLKAEWCLRDALFVASTLHVFQRHSRLGMANYAQMVNVLGAVMTDESSAVATPVHQAFALLARCTEAFHVPVELESPATFFNERYGQVSSRPDNPLIDAACSISENRDRMALTVVNRSWSQPVRIGLEIQGSRIKGEGTLHILTHRDPHARNSFKDPEQVRMKSGPLDAGCSELEVPAHAVVGIRVPIEAEPG